MQIRKAGRVSTFFHILFLHAGLVRDEGHIPLRAKLGCPLSKGRLNGSDSALAKDRFEDEARQIGGMRKSGYQLIEIVRENAKDFQAGQFERCSHAVRLT